MTESTDVAELPAKLVQQFINMVTLIPDAEEGDAAGLLSAVLGGTTMSDLDAPWNGGRGAPIGPLLCITGIAKAPSDYPGGLPFYLIIDHQTASMPEPKQYATGATMVVAQLVKAHELDEFPLVGAIVETALKKNPSQKAQHFQIDREETDRARAALKKARGK